MKEQIKTALLSLLAIAAALAAINLAAVDYQCTPHKPVNECEAGLYEIRIYENPNEKIPLGMAETPCVVDLGNRYRAYDTWFHTRARSDYMESIEFPKAADRTEICKIQ